jgi:hypothetical protein
MFSSYKFILNEWLVQNLGGIMLYYELSPPCINYASIYLQSHTVAFSSTWVLVQILILKNITVNVKQKNSWIPHNNLDKEKIYTLGNTSQINSIYHNKI